MPKLKTRTGVKKRFKMTSGGKVKRRKAYARHILSKKDSARLRKLGKAVILEGRDKKIIKKLLPYG